MSQNKNVSDKLYYSISEVSRMTGLEQYVLRYWEKEFPTLKPKKSRGGNRTYTQKDIDIINRIKHLRTKEKLTIAGARNRLTMRRSGEQKKSMYQTARAKTIIGQIRQDIEDILKEIS
ncbi:MAG: MerR family transcriptional regulator [Candidatus Zixiibacteriota bacterium]|nr:MAG: MerR family transcriptional regulator [candidate division Zixibacteria bacterium]